MTDENIVAIKGLMISEIDLPTNKRKSNNNEILNKRLSRLKLIEVLNCLK